MEEWRTVEGTDKEVEISSLGRVRVIVPNKYDRQGYASNKFVGAVHVAIAHAFLGPCPPECIVHHKDGNPENNREDNLEYVTRQDHIEKHKVLQKEYPELIQNWIHVLYDTGFSEKRIAQGLRMPQKDIHKILFQS